MIERFQSTNETFGDPAFRFHVELLDKLKRMQVWSAPRALPDAAEFISGEGSHSI